MVLVSSLQAVPTLDLLSTVIGLSVGIVAAVIVSYFVFFSRPKVERVEVARRDSSGTLTVASVSAGDLERSRREMRTMMVERDLLSSALMKVYEAETDGRITREERESIARRYSDQIKGIQSKLKDVELVVEVGELEKLRVELVNMFQEKIQNIETRLDQAKERLGAVSPQVVKQEPILRVERGAELERVIEKRTRPDMSDSERRVREIRDEVMEALTKLEQIDIEKKPQEST
jgi:hypothetical protein